MPCLAATSTSVARRGAGRSSSQRRRAATRGRVLRPSARHDIATKVTDEVRPHHNRNLFRRPLTSASTTSTSMPDFSRPFGPRAASTGQRSASSTRTQTSTSGARSTTSMTWRRGVSPSGSRRPLPAAGLSGLMMINVTGKGQIQLHAAASRRKIAPPLESQARLMPGRA